MRQTSFLKTVLCSGIALLALTGAAMAQTRDFDVPASDMKTALDTYTRQAGVQLIFRPKDAAGISSPGFQGALPVDAATRSIRGGRRMGAPLPFLLYDGDESLTGWPTWDDPKLALLQVKSGRSRSSPRVAGA